MSLPPRARSRAASGLDAAAASGQFALQVCCDCGVVQYPPREACRRCLSLELEWRKQSGEGTLLAQTTLFHSYEEFFRERLPWRIGLIRLNCDVTVVAHLHSAVQDEGTPVRIDAALDRSGSAVLIALPRTSAVNMHDDRQLRDLVAERQVER